MSTDSIKIPGPQNGYTDLIDLSLMQRQEEDTGSYFPLRPSAAGYCAKRLAFELERYYGICESVPKEKKDPETLRLLNLGSSIEWHSIKNFDLIAKLAPELKVRYKQQVVSLFDLKPVYDEVPPHIEGSIDLTIVNSLTGEGGVGDVKSKKDKFNSFFKTEWDSQIDKYSRMTSLIQLTPTAWYAPDLEAFLTELSDPFFEDNFYQVNAYLCTEWAKKHNMTHGFVYRYGKNDSRHVEIRFAPSPKLYKKLEEKFNSIYRNVVLGTIENVKPDCFVGSAKCAFHSFAGMCWGNDALQAYFKTFPKKSWPVDASKLGDDLVESISAYEALQPAVENREKIEQEVLRIMVERDEPITKIKSPSGLVWEARFLKSPKEHFELRRSKA